MSDLVQRLRLSSNDDDSLPSLAADEIERLKYEAAWIRRKLDLPLETKLLSGNQSLAGKMHVVCSEAAGYERYVKSYKCDDKQGEIARQSVRIVEQEKEIDRLRAQYQRLQSEMDAWQSLDGINWHKRALKAEAELAQWRDGFEPRPNKELAG